MADSVARRRRRSHDHAHRPANLVVRNDLAGQRKSRRHRLRGTVGTGDDAAGDKRSLVIAMTGLVQLMQFYGRYTDASRLASRHVELLDSIGDPELTVGLLITPMIVKWSAGEVTQTME